MHKKTKDIFAQLQADKQSKTIIAEAIVLDANKITKQHQMHRRTDKTEQHACKMQNLKARTVWNIEQAKFWSFNDTRTQTTYNEHKTERHDEL